MAEIDDPTRSHEFRDFPDDVKWIRRSCGFRIQRRQKVGTVNQFEILLTAHAVFSARVRCVDMDTQYGYILDQSMLSVVSSGLTVHLGTTDAHETGGNESYSGGFLTGAANVDFDGSGLKIDNWNCQDHGDGTSTITVSMSVPSNEGWRAEP